jgi:Polyketide cyclase / dehydrase and lipid transport
LVAGSRALRLLERRFNVKAALARVWNHLERVESWPTWARHIRRIDLRPPGPLCAESSGSIVLANGIRSTFRMEELRPGVSWKWAGPFLWLRVHYDHRFTTVGPAETEVGFILEAEGLGAWSRSRGRTRERDPAQPRRRLSPLSLL